MTWVDRIRAQADELGRMAQQGIELGQARFEEMQDRRVQDGLFRQLGAAYYDAQRHGGDPAEVERLLAALDRHREQRRATPQSWAAATTATDGTPSTEGGVSMEKAPMEEPPVDKPPAPPREDGDPSFP